MMYIEFRQKLMEKIIENEINSGYFGRIAIEFKIFSTPS